MGLWDKGEEERLGLWLLEKFGRGLGAGKDVFGRKRGWNLDLWSR